MQIKKEVITCSIYFLFMLTAVLLVAGVGQLGLPSEESLSDDRAEEIESESSSFNGCGNLSSGECTKYPQCKLISKINQPLIFFYIF